MTLEQAYKKVYMMDKALDSDILKKFKKGLDTRSKM